MASSSEQNFDVSARVHAHAEMRIQILHQDGEFPERFWPLVNIFETVPGSWVLALKSVTASESQALKSGSASENSQITDTLTYHTYC